MTAKVEIRMSLPSTARLREHWRTAEARERHQRETIRVVLRDEVKERPTLPVTVTLTRVAVRALNGDAWRITAKNVRKGVADFLGVADCDARVRWGYMQEKTNDPYYQAVRIEIEETDLSEHVARVADDVF